MFRSIFKKMCLLALMSSILLYAAFLYIKHDWEVHFSNKPDIEHMEYIRHHTTHQEKISFHGFLFEEHKIQTDDGYIMSAWRIPGRISEGRNKNNAKPKRAVILTHGLLDSGYTFFAHGENESLPFLLADHGFDVWIANNRGTLFSKEHVDPAKNGNSISSDFWNFTFHEMAKYDVIANIRYVKQVTGNEKVSYICHSQGCTQFILGYTMNPDFFEQNIDKFGTMGAVLKYTHIKKLFPNLMKSIKLFEWFEYFGIRNVMSFTPETIKAFGYLCHKALWICKHVISAVVQNEDTKHIEWDQLSNLYYNQPGGSSAKNLIHWLQIIGEEEVRMFDYGPKKNLEVYGTEKPPKYDIDKLKNMTIDTFITTTSGDPYCLKEDFQLMLKTFTKAKIYTKDVGNYNHLDYLWGKNAHMDIYQDLIKFLNDV